MYRLQSRVIGEVVGPEALLPGIALSSEGSVQYGRHRRKTVISLRSPSLVLLVVGSTPSSSFAQFVLWFSNSQHSFMWHRPATPSCGSLFPYDQPVPSPVVANAGGVTGCRGFRPTASAPYRTCTSVGPFSAGPTVSSPACHTLR